MDGERELDDFYGELWEEVAGASDDETDDDEDIAQPGPIYRASNFRRIDDL